MKVRVDPLVETLDYDRAIYFDLIEHIKVSIGCINRPINNTVCQKAEIYAIFQAVDFQLTCVLRKVVKRTAVLNRKLVAQVKVQISAGVCIGIPGCAD